MLYVGTCAVIAGFQAPIVTNCSMINLQYVQLSDHAILVKRWDGKLLITLSQPVTSATSPFAGNFHPKA
jgi:hypothetical protein